MAVSLLYYTVFYAVSAVQAARGHEYGKHSTVRAVFNREFVKTGKVSEELGRLYNTLFQNRHDADYKPAVKFSDEYVKEKIGLTRHFLALFKAMLKEGAA